MSNRRLALAIWATAILVSGIWWPLSFRYSAGFTMSHSAPPGRTAAGLGNRSDQGIAIVSGMGKMLVYLSWDSAFTRSGFFFDPVMPHQFPHPWLGFQKEGGRLWISFPVALAFLLIASAACLHFYRFR